ncbi:response regulator [Kordiimonas gwangyangensis]|uniref:response regulator n=1 Tax=Kordiimonas gwangyangensis TaxID=288022 RepID=UPI0003771C56|nr:response regulator [Kordiimonas gwangyangensis]
MSDDFLIIEDDETDDEGSPSPLEPHTPWRILIVDDEPDVHSATKLALKGFHFDDRPLEFVSAMSGAEARELLRGESGFAVILLDVVMEADDAGLKLVEFIREEIGDHSVRIVLRTGQPGQAPERDVIVRYDINDYKEKTDLSATKLFTLMYATLRSFRDINIIEASRRGLERVIGASAQMFKEQFLDNFARGVLEQVSSLIVGGLDVAFTLEEAAAATHDRKEMTLVAGTGRFKGSVGHSAWGVFPARIASAIEEHRERGRGEYGFWVDGSYVGMVVGNSGRASILYLVGEGKPKEIDTQLIQIFVRNVLIAVENLYLRNALVDTQREVVFRLTEAVETRSNETGNHVKRVAELSRILGEAMGMSQYDVEMLKHASPLHDVGKIGIPDAILNKPGRHTDEERAIMMTHAKLGYEILEGSDREMLRVAANIARDHHEKWDGSGYPSGLKGEEISMVGRITAIADVFDALLSVRCYKPAWAEEDVIKLLKEERGKHFQPELVDALLDHLPEIRELYVRYRDEPAAGEA